MYGAEQDKNNFNPVNSHWVQMLMLSILHVSAWACLIRSDYNFVFLFFAYFYLVSRKDFVSISIVYNTLYPRYFIQLSYLQLWIYFFSSLYLLHGWLTMKIMLFGIIFDLCMVLLYFFLLLFSYQNYHCCISYLHLNVNQHPNDDHQFLCLYEQYFQCELIFLSQMRTRQKHPYHHLEFQRTLTPLLSRIRKDNIHCYHQLESHQSKQEKNNMNRPFKVFIPEQTFNTSTISSGGNRTSINFRTNQKNSKNKTNMQFNKTISQQSKVKKHLIERIDIEQIEEILNYKTNKITKFEQFCNKSYHKKTKITSREQKINAKTIHVCEPTFPRVNMQINKNNYIITKRKFWTRQHAKSNENYELNDNFLRGVSMNKKQNQSELIH